MDKKAMLGPKIRRLRRENGLTQVQLSEQLGISASYLNLIEHNQRPVSVPLVLKLARLFDLDLQAFDEDEEERALAGLREVFADPLFERARPGAAELREVVSTAPAAADAVIELYRALQAARQDLQSLSERAAEGDGKAAPYSEAFPIEKVHDFFEARSNHFPEIEEAAEELGRSVPLAQGELVRGLTEALGAHGFAVRVLPHDVMGATLRRFDRHGKRVLLSELLPPPSRAFNLAHQIALVRHRPLLDRIAADAPLAGEPARRLARIGLANYFAGAVMMPYQRFLEAAQANRYDIEVLQHRFEASFEQVAHRLTTLQRRGARGIPFSFLRVDCAGNVSKRYAGGGLPIPRFGGACPRLLVFDAFRHPGEIRAQVAAMPSGTTYLEIARDIARHGGSFRVPAQRLAVGLSCELGHAAQIVYADRLDTARPENATPVGPTCRLCERLDCAERAFPPLAHRLAIDENIRSLSAYVAAARRLD
jgi:predicted transcriptional regulator/DNA-binding XRE family transcriptional regulator